MNISENLITFDVFFEVDFNKMPKQLLPNIADKVRLTYLPCTVNEQNLIGLFQKETFYE